MQATLHRRPALDGTVAGHGRALSRFVHHLVGSWLGILCHRDEDGHNTRNPPDALRLFCSWRVKRLAFDSRNNLVHRVMHEFLSEFGEDIGLLIVKGRFHRG